MAHPPRVFAALRTAAPAAAVALAFTAPALAADHSGHHSGHRSEATTTAPSQTTPATASGATTASPAPDAMWVIADPSRPRVTAGPRGPLWRAYPPRAVGTTAMGLTFAERYLAAQFPTSPADDPSAVRRVLTTAQATKKLSKKCQRLVKLKSSKQLKKLKKSDKKARTKCLEQRRKIIADSKKKPETKPGSSTPTTPSNPAPGPSPAPSSPANPAPTTPTNVPTPEPNPQPAECTTPGTGPVRVTAIDEGSKFELSTCGVRAGAIDFTFDNTDGNEEHNLVMADGVTSGGGPEGTVRVISVNIAAGETRSKSFTLPAGSYVLICTVEGHGPMTVPFKVFPA